MIGFLDVLGGLAGGERERRARSFELIERAERGSARIGRPVVVRIDGVATVRVFLFFPHRVHVVRYVGGRLIVADDREYSVDRVPTACHGQRALGSEADLAAEFAVTGKE